MKTRILIAALLAGTLRVYSQYTVSLSIKGYKASRIYLLSYYGVNTYRFDSAEWNPQGTAVFQRTNRSLLPGMYALELSDTCIIDFLVGNEKELSIVSDTHDIAGNLRVEGSPEALAYSDYFRACKRAERMKARNAGHTRACSADSAVLLKKQMDEASRQERDLGTRLMAQYPNTLLSVLIRLMQMPSASDMYSADTALLKNFSTKHRQYIDVYFNGIDFSNEALVRLPQFEEKISFFFNYLLQQQPDTLIRSFDKLLARSEANNEVYKFNLRWLFRNYYNRYESKTYEPCFIYLVDKYYMKGKAFWAKDAFIRLLAERVEMMRPTLYGTKAPDLKLITHAGKSFSLYQVQSPYTILYFYEFDCGYCRLETPKLQEIYSKYKGKVEVVAVYMMADKAKWLEYIEQNKLKWINAHDPTRESNIRDQYFIQKVPTIYLLDKDKKVLEKRVSADELKDILKTVIK